MGAHIQQRLRTEVEGTCTGRYGYIISVQHISDPGKGRILPGHGFAEFSVKFIAIVCKPFKGEVLEGVVTSVNKFGLHIAIGPVDAFVSKHLMPADMEFDPHGDPPKFFSEDAKYEKGSKVRVRIIGTRLDAAQIYCVASIKDDYCGVLNLK